MQEWFWWWQCSDRHIIPLFPHTHTPFPLSLMSLVVSVDAKHHVYLLISHQIRSGLFSDRNVRALSSPLPLHIPFLHLRLPLCSSLSNSHNWASLLCLLLVTADLPQIEVHGIDRESNPGLPHDLRVFYHWTTNASNVLLAILSAMKTTTTTTKNKNKKRLSCALSFRQARNWCRSTNTKYYDNCDVCCTDLITRTINNDSNDNVHCMIF